VLGKGQITIDGKVMETYIPAKAKIEEFKLPYKYWRVEKGAHPNYIQSGSINPKILYETVSLKFKIGIWMA
jgi:hypothetical protein